MSNNIAHLLVPATMQRVPQAVLRMLCSVLDTRRQHPAAVQVAMAVEQVGARCFVALTMKLSEQQFKPLFLMLLEWATTAHPDGASLLLKWFD